MAPNFANKIGDYNRYNYNTVLVPCLMHIYVCIYYYYFSIVLSSTNNILQLLILFTGTVLYRIRHRRKICIESMLRTGANTIEKEVWVLCLFMKNYLIQFVTGIISLIFLISLITDIWIQNWFCHVINIIFLFFF